MVYWLCGHLPVRRARFKRNRSEYRIQGVARAQAVRGEEEWNRDSRFTLVILPVLPELVCGVVALLSAVNPNRGCCSAFCNSSPRPAVAQKLAFQSQAGPKDGGGALQPPPSVTNTGKNMKEHPANSLKLTCDHALAPVHGLMCRSGCDIWCGCVVFSLFIRGRRFSVPSSSRLFPEPQAPVRHGQVPRGGDIARGSLEWGVLEKNMPSVSDIHW